LVFCRQRSAARLEWAVLSRLKRDESKAFKNQPICLNNTGNTVEKMIGSENTHARHVYSPLVTKRVTLPGKHGAPCFRDMLGPV
jgi:hypothetical protein